MSQLSHAHVRSKTASLQPLLDAALLRCRTPLLNLLIKQYECCKNGHFQIIMLEGQEGVGKTYVAQNFLHFLQWDVTQTAAVFYNRAIAAERHHPYHPVLAMLQAWTTHEAVTPQLSTLPYTGELLRLLPALAERYPELSLSCTDDKEQARLHLAQAVAALGLAIAQTKPLVICLDNMQWADDSTLALLCALVSCWRDSATPILLLFCLRLDLVAARPMLASWHTYMQQPDVPTASFTLVPFTNQEVIATIHLLAAQQTALNNKQLDTIGLWLAILTGGNPLYLLEVLRLLLAHNWIEVQRQSVQFRNVVRKSSRWMKIIPPGLHSLIYARLSLLSTHAKAILAALAASRQGLTAAQLLTLTGLSKQEGREALGELVNEQFLVAEANTTYYFTHESIGHILYSHTDSEQRLLLHQRIAALQQQEKVAPALLIEHAMAGQLYEQAFHAAMAAGDEATLLFASQDATAFYGQAEQALHQLAQQPSTTTSIERLYRLFARIYQ
jgi:predicted ATPase